MGEPPLPEGSAPLPPDEEERVRDLTDLGAVDVSLEPSLTGVAELAARICRTPIGLVNLVGDRLQHLVGRFGLDITAVSRRTGFCPHVICSREMLLVPDALKDPRFHIDPAVVGDPWIRFYAGVPVVSDRGYVLGTVCVLDRRSRRLSPEQCAALRALAVCVVALLEHHHEGRQAEQVAQRLQELDDLKQTFLRNINHELRTPLTSIRTYLDLVREGDIDPDTQQRFMEVIERNSDRLLERLDELLLLASLSAQSVSFNPEPADLSALVAEAVAEAGEKAGHRGHTLVLDAPRPVTAWVDPQRIRIALVHLLGNAIKFTPGGGRIDVAVTGDPGPAIAIHDTGVGVTEEEAARAFDAFYRAPHSEEQAIGGTGIGLAIVKEIVQMHGGTVAMTGGPGGGTTVRVTLLPPP
ncbi:GAF domain-containing sensor histidine kinase [Spirillospora albida]|uniref:GAF domain-containing sensor histidine kinase n=1 Tax=Spirillospora albida TaxID=58123 RepID=UPI0004C17693|nr:GAF domain-containing sensor histidine kinase [Spirillospora albida]